MKKILILVLVLLFSVTAMAESRIGIISAMDNEVQLLLGEAQIDRVEQIGGVNYNVGTLCGKDVVIANAGIGKVLAAAGITSMLNRFDIDCVIFTGIAGGVSDDTRPLDIVVATSLVQHDFGMTTDDGFVWGLENQPYDGRYACDPALVDLACAVAAEVVGEDHTFKGIIATGDQFIASKQYAEKLQKQFDAIACEMEGAAVALVCTQYNTPFVVIRAMSDKADDVATETYDNFADLAANNSGKIVMEILNRF